MLKLIRWFLIIFLSLLLVGGGALLYFWLTFDPNHYRPLLEKKLTEALGLDVRAGNLSLVWQNGLVLQLTGVRVGGLSGDVPLFETESFLIRFDPLGFLRMRLGLIELEIMRPQILLVKRSDGSKNWEFALPGQEAKPAQKGGVPLMLSTAKIEEGRLYYRDETQRPPLEIELRGINTQIISRISGTLDIETGLQEDTVQLKGEVSPLGNPPKFQGRLQLDHFDLDRLTHAASQGEGRGFLGGEVSGNFEFQDTGKDAGEILSRLQGKGLLTFRNGVLRDFNFARALLQKITIIPGLEAAALSAVPAEFQDLFTSRDTGFESMECQFSIQTAQLALESFFLRSSHFTVQGAGEVNLLGEIALKAQFIFKERVSDYLIHRVSELSYLANPQRQIVIPFRAQGRLPQLRIQPDVGGLARRVVSQQGTRLLEEGLDALSKFMGENKQ